MSYITGLTSIVKGQRGEIFFNKDQFLFATDFASDPYFADELNWQKIAVYYADASSGQRQVIILMDDHGRGWFAPSVMARSGDWSVEKIEVYDKQGDFFTIGRDNMPSPEGFDVAVQRVVAPSPSLLAVQENAELVSNGTFNSDISGWVALAGAQWNAGKAEQTAQATEERGFIVVLSTEVGKTYEYKLDTLAASNVIIANGTKADKAGVVLDAIVTRLNVPAGAIRGQFIAGATSVSILVQSAFAANAIQFDNVSAKKVPHIVETAAGMTSILSPGFKVKIWDDNAGAFISNEVYLIDSLLAEETKDIVTLNKQIVGDWAGKTLRLRFPSFSEVSGKQASLYQYVGTGY